MKKTIIICLALSLVSSATEVFAQSQSDGTYQTALPTYTNTNAQQPSPSASGSGYSTQLPTYNGSESSNTGGNGSNSSNSTGNGGESSNTEAKLFYLQNPLDQSKFNTVGGIINGFADIFTYLAVLFAVLMIIYVGLRFVLAQGNPVELTTRKDQLLWLLVGVAIIIGARLIVSVVVKTLETAGVVNTSVTNSANNALIGH